MSRFRVSYRRLTHPVTIAFALLIVVGVALSALIGAQRAEHARVQHTMEVREAIMSLRLSIDESQNSIRGYIITAGEDFLERYNAAKDILPLQVSNVRQLTGDNARQQETLDKLAPRVDELLRIFANRVDTMRTQGREAILNNMNRAGKVVTDEVAALLDAMAAEEARLLLERQDAAERSAMFIQVLVVVSLIAAITFGLLNAIEGSRQRKAIQAGHDELQETHQKLLDEEFLPARLK